LIETNLDLDMMRASGKILSLVLNKLTKEYLMPGVTPLELDQKAEEIIRSYSNATPAFFGYSGFKNTACISVNSQVVHGVPSKKPLEEGDIVSIDCGVVFSGHFTDACRTASVGECDHRKTALIEVTKRSLDKGIKQAVVGNHISDSSFAIQHYVERSGFSVSRNYCGHGIGWKLHQDPKIPNFGVPKTGPLYQEGGCYAIEPVVFDGPTKVFLYDDGWTVGSFYGNFSAHFEDTIIVTKKGPEIITR
jgi:methionyl aminopeptidase